MQILPHPKAKRTCNCCGIRFVPLHPQHRYCRDCWAWHRISQNLAANQRLLREVWR